MIPKEIIQRVKDAANDDLVGVIRAMEPGLDLQKKGISYTCCCPFHSERTPSFVVTPSKRRWHCFGGCSEGGDAIDFVMRSKRCSYMEAIRELAAYCHITLPGSMIARPEMVKVARSDSYLFGYRPLSAHDLTYCGLSEDIDPALVGTISIRTQLFALRWYVLPGKRTGGFSWKIMEKPLYPLLIFCWKNPDGSEWGVIYQPEAPAGKKLSNFGIQREGTVFYDDHVAALARGLRSGAVTVVNIAKLLELWTR